MSVIALFVRLFTVSDWYLYFVLPKTKRGELEDYQMVHYSNRNWLLLKLEGQNTWQLNNFWRN